MYKIVHNIMDIVVQYITYVCMDIGNVMGAPEAVAVLVGPTIRPTWIMSIIGCVHGHIYVTNLPYVPDVVMILKVTGTLLDTY